MPPWDRPDAYELEQRAAIQAWKDTPPSVVSRALGYGLRPLGWAVSRIIPRSALEGALRGAHWLAQWTIFEKGVFEKVGVTTPEELKQLNLKDLDALAERFHQWAIGYAVAEGAASGSLGLPGIAIDIPLLVTMALRTVRGIGICYGHLSGTEAERDFALGVLAAAGANSLQEKTAALLVLRQLQVQS
jgi:hypothetical protein